MDTAEIDRIIRQLGFSTEGLTLAQFREVLGVYLEQVTQALDFDMKLDG